MGTRRKSATWLVFPALLGIALPAPGWAQEMPAPVDRQVELLVRVLQFDRNLEGQAPDELVVAIVYQSRFRASLTAHDAALAGLEQSRMGDRPIRCVSVELEEHVSAAAALAASGAAVAYVAPLRATDLKDIVSATRALGILSSTGVPEYVDAGIAIGISLRGERPEILVNLDASLAEGARLSSELLQLSRVVTTGREPQ